MSPRERLIRQLAVKYGLDPEAVVSIASVEGQRALHGGISVGDHGTSFGPFQLHAGGALPKGKGSAWAHSRAGIDYAERQMAQYARGLHGKAAVSAISSRFERPADVPGEIAKAMGFYGRGGSTPGAGPAGAPGAGGAGADPVQGLSQQAFRSMAASSLLQPGGADGSSLMAMAVARKQMMAAQQQYGDGAQGAVVPKQPGAIPGGVQFIGNTQGVKPAFLRSVSQAAMSVGGTKIRVRSGYRSPAHNAAVGGVGHSNHMTGDAMDGDVFIPHKGWVPLGVALQTAAGQYGLRSGNVPGFYHGGRDPVHVDDGANQR